MSGFVHLHNHTTYSLLDGAQKVDEMCARAAEDGQSAIAITDHGNLFGAMAFGKQAAKQGIQPIIGMEAYVAPTSRHEKQRQEVPGVGRKNYFHLVLLAQNYTGYKNLIRLASAGYLEGFYYRPRIDRELLAEHMEGLVCLSACLASEVATYLAHDQYDRARDAALWHRELFGPENYWLEVQDHGIEQQAKVNQGMLRLSRELDLGLVATNDCHYLLQEDHTAHDCLICIQTGTTRSNKSGMSYTRQHYLKSGAEMADLFSWAPQAIENTVRIAESCQFAFDKQPLHLPEFPTPSGYDIDGYFEKVARDGLEERLQRLRGASLAGELLHDEEAYRDRLALEIRIIREMGFPGYFLIVWDFMRYARDNGIPVGPGRGSAAGSLVAYSMRITDIDPMQNELLFERFLNPERVSMPDIDIDFCFRRRGQVIDYVTGKYGRANVAQIITFGTMAARAVIRDVGRVLEVPYGDVDRIAKLVPAVPGQEITIAQSLAEVDTLREEYEKDARVREMLDLAQRLEGLTRHASTHAAGVVIAPEPIVEFAPVYRGTKEGDEVTTQFDKDEIEEIGLLKMDFLGLKTLTLIDDALCSIGEVTGERPNLDDLTLDDPEVYAVFSKGDTGGVFQFESSGMKDILRRLKPTRFEDLVALNALYRPGPLGGGLVDDFIKRRHGKVKVEYLHPDLEEILRETYGVIVYQEQVMQIAAVMGGFSLGEADNLRRAMGKKKKEVMDSERERFVARAKERKIAPKIAEKTFELMAYFAGYGFNKSHSAAYALVAYQTAWLKAHHPVHFMAALLTTEKANSDKLTQYVGACRDMGIEVLPPDVNRSGLDFTVEGDKVRFGLSAIKNVGEGAIRSLLDSRKEAGTFETLHGLCAEIDSRTINKRVLEALVQSGALDSLEGTRGQLVATIDSALEFGQKQRADREAGQGSLFGGEADTNVSTPKLVDAPDWDKKTRLGYEKASLGFYVSGHPLEGYRTILRDFSTHDAAALKELDSGRDVSIGGVVAQLKRRKAKKTGDWWAQLELEDLAGHIEVLIFPKAYRECESLLEDERPVLVSGRLENQDQRCRLIAETVIRLEEVREQRAEAVQVRIDAAQLEETVVDALIAAIGKHRGEAKLYFEIARAGAYRLVAMAESNHRVAPTPEFSETLERILGEDRVRYRAKTFTSERKRHRPRGARAPGPA